MRKAYSITGKGKKMIPAFKRLEDAENEILEKAGE
jgi:predicted transcriptional regulator